MKTLSFGLAIASGLLASVSASDKIHPSVHRSLQATGSVDILISFKDGTQDALGRVDVEARARDDRVTAVVELLEQHAKQTQKDVIDLAAKYKAAGAAEPRETTSSGNGSTTADVAYLADARSFWLTNQVWIGGASAAFVKMVSALSTVSAVIEDELVPFTEPNVEEEIKKAIGQFATDDMPFAGTDDGSTSPIQWGITTVRAPELWAQGITGKGIVIGSMDTGVRVTHEVLASTYRGDFGWYDAVAQRTEPYDDVGHGTHTMATMVGQNGYGVAPGATWMACKSCGTNGCRGSALVACAQWLTCPTSVATGKRDCTKAPHVINNSWGGGKDLTYFNAAIDGWRKAGIIPVFSNGNNGPKCSTVSSPADLATVISVGATDRTDALASFSSKGPVTGSRVKPDIAAPGALVRSALQTADNAYGLMSGTSMAAPHVSGLVVLMLSQQPTLSFNQILTLLRGGTRMTGLKATGSNCGGIDESLFPNNAYGAGRIDGVLTLQKLITPTAAPTAAPTQAPTDAPYQQRIPAQQQQPYLQREAIRSVDAPPAPVAAADTDFAGISNSSFNEGSISFR